MIGSPSKLYKLLQKVPSIPGNAGGSLLTMQSTKGLVFGVFTVIGNFGTVFFGEQPSKLRSFAESYLIGAGVALCAALCSLLEEGQKGHLCLRFFFGLGLAIIAWLVTVQSRFDRRVRSVLVALSRSPSTTPSYHHALQSFQLD
ncbi:hypothetical protein CF326_g7621 [Tilletia indica]|nr:hypothetical protein CF326_g7621 [Tilletia indica]